MRHARLPALLVLSLALMSCATPTGVATRYPGNGEAVTPVPAAPSQAVNADAAFASGDYITAMDGYLQTAATATPAEAAELRLRAADAAARANQPVQADAILDQIPATPLDARQQARYRLLRAQVALARNDSARALRLLPQLDPGGEPAIAERELLVRARAAFRLGDAVTATQALVIRERYLSPAEIAANREAIWAGLTTTPLDANTQTRANAVDPLTRGWVELALLARRSAPLGEYEHWRNRFPGHPGEEKLATLYMPATGAGAGAVAEAPVAQTGTAMPLAPVVAARGSAALLLSRTGAVAGVSEAVRAGYAAAAARAGQAEPTFYDVAATPAAEALRQAAAAGAGLAVGPLRREDVIAVAAAGPPPVPVLALNFLDVGRAAPAGFYQLGLAPEDEARAAAEDAAARGLRAALVLVPNTERGARVLGAFQQRFGELGGHVVDSGRYYGQPQYWSDSVQKLLRYTAVDDKKKLAELRAQAQPGIEPQRRNDFDMLFIDGKASQARILWPLFRFYRAERMPIYATAGVNEGNGDSDLAGIRFCDSPWLLDPSLAALRAEAEAGRNRDTARLFALGNDAFLLAQRMTGGGLRPGDEIAGASGVLKPDAGGAFHRGLICAQTSIGPPNVMSGVTSGVSGRVAP